MVGILEERGLDRVLVNSAADWGKSDPLLKVRTGDAMLAAGFSDDDVDQVLWRNPVAFYGQSGRLLLDMPPRPAHLRGQLAAAGGHRMRFRHPDGTTVHLAYCTNVHPAEDLDGVLAQLATTATGAPAARPDRSGSACGCPPRTRPGWSPTRRRWGGCAPNSPPRPGGRHPQRVPYEGFGAEEVK